MYARIRGTILAGAVVMVVTGCNPIGEPWDSAGYFDEDRSRSEQVQEQLRHRLAHTQDGA